MKKVIILISLFLLVFCQTNAVYGSDTMNLHAKAAILFEAKSGQVLYEKGSKSPYPNASTTKILTCYYIILYGKLSDTVKISKNAANQPKVHLGVREGENYKVEDLLYGLMLESYNDCAVALAEYMSQSVPKFEKQINAFAKELGAKKTHFVTPNGLDASDKQGSHKTTAYDLALMMSHCIQNKRFLKITRTSSYSFSDKSGQRKFTCVNHNALLQMMQGVISGKTGYTSKAGYCYVGAINVNSMKFVVVLLGCGWPPHKTYKWIDVEKLVAYGKNTYELHTLKLKHTKLKKKVVVNKGVKKNVRGHILSKNIQVLKKKNERIRTKYFFKNSVNAPITKNTKIGSVTYLIGKRIILSQPIYTTEIVLEKTIWWYFGKVLIYFFMP